MVLSPTFKDKFEDENRMPEAFYHWMQSCPVLWIKGEAHSDYMTYLFQSTGEVIVREGEEVEFSEIEAPASKKKTKQKKH
jgi:hypothetical protein